MALSPDVVYFGSEQEQRPIPIRLMRTQESGDVGSIEIRA
jgi:hypothetical protein